MYWYLKQIGVDTARRVSFDEASLLVAKRFDLWESTSNFYLAERERVATQSRRAFSFVVLGPSTLLCFCDSKGEEFQLSDTDYFQLVVQ